MSIEKQANLLTSGEQRPDITFRVPNACGLTCAGGFADTEQVKLCEDPSSREEGGTAGEREVTGGTAEGSQGEEGGREEGSGHDRIKEYDMIFLKQQNTLVMICLSGHNPRHN